MDSALFQTLISVVIGSAVTLIASYLTQHWSRSQSLEQDYDTKLEEIQNLYIDIKMHLEAELRDWWIGMEYGNGEVILSTYVYPIDRIIMLAERYEPALLEDIKAIERVISDVRAYEDPDLSISFRDIYYSFVVNAGSDFENTKKRLSDKFEKINKRYYKKRGSKLLPLSKKSFIFRSNSQNQNPHVQHSDQDAVENIAHETFSVDR